MKYHEGVLLQLIIYTSLWLYDDYVGLLICIVMTSIMAALLLFSLVVELIEKSKVPKSYFIWMLLSIVPPIMVSLLFLILSEGQFQWMNQF